MDEVTVLDVQRKVLELILPRAEELALLAHVHQRKTATNALEGATEATVLCNRLPEPGGHSTVHLVSLEKRYKDGKFDFDDAKPDDWIRLVSLMKWSFFSVDPDQTFSALLRRLNREPSVLRLPETPARASAATPYLEQGFIPFPHQMRRGSKSVSFYRGPLVPGANPGSLVLPVQCSDELLRYDPATGLLDVSYASAWEMGRLLTLANSRVALELFQWKRRVAQWRHALRQRAQRSRRLPLRQVRSEEPEMPEVVEAWFKGLEVLEGLPFSYLVPDERMLPVEGLRFFQVDPLWVDCLLDGAYSVGRVTEADWEQDREMRGRRSLRQRAREVSGFLMRSSVVSGYPGLLVEAYPDREESPGSIPAKGLEALRIEPLSEDVLIGLFAGDVKTVDFFQEPEGLSFGLDVPTSDPPVYTKNLRNRSGEGTTIIIESIPWHHEDPGVLDVKELAALMKSKLEEPRFTAAQFALQMIEGGPRIRFVSGK